MSQQPSQTEFAPIVRAVFDDLDMRQLAVLRSISGAQRLQMAFEMCQPPRERIVASIRAHNPSISLKELERQVIECIAKGPVPSK